jgi:hypothetical protein
LNVARKMLGVLAAPDPLSLLATKGFNHGRILTCRVSIAKHYQDNIRSRPQLRLIRLCTIDSRPDIGVARTARDPGEDT